MIISLKGGFKGLCVVTKKKDKSVFLGLVVLRCSAFESFFGWK